MRVIVKMCSIYIIYSGHFSIHSSSILSLSKLATLHDLITSQFTNMMIERKVKRSKGMPTTLNNLHSLTILKPRLRSDNIMYDQRNLCTLNIYNPSLIPKHEILGELHCF
jgi:ABC-type uncharacterized transport system YnjBCD permease subunit